MSKKFLTAENEKPDTILKLEFDQPIEPIALGAPSEGSLTAGRKMADGQIDLGKPATFDRVEFTIENPGHLRGVARKFVLETLQPDGTWKPVLNGAVYGSIFSKRIAPVTARQVRLNIENPVRRFDLFPTGK